MAPGSERDGPDAEKTQSDAKRNPLVVVGLLTLILAFAIAFLWLTKQILNFEGDAVYLGLLLVPVVTYLALTGKLEDVQFLGASVRLIKSQAREVKKKVSEVGQYGPERSRYLGKLRQTLDKDGKSLVLIYADVDKLRGISAKRYIAERNNGTAPGGRRRTEREIRDEIIDRLALSLMDSFYDANIEGAKQDQFRLEEPDVAMILRSVDTGKAKLVAGNALADFHKNDPDGATATAVVISVHNAKGVGARQLDNFAADELSKSKDVLEGTRGTARPVPFFKNGRAGPNFE